MMATNLSKILRHALGSFRNMTSRLSVVAAAAQCTVIRKLNTVATKGPTFTISGEGKKLKALWNTETPPSTYHAVWLRHNCHCPQCLSGNNQKSVLTTSVDPNVAIADFKIEGEDLKFKMSCGHEGQMNIDWLRKHCYSSHTLQTTVKNSTPDTSRLSSLPTIQAEELDDDYGVWRWLKAVNEHGVCLVRGCVPEIDTATQMAKRIAYIQKTLYGNYSEIRTSNDQINISYSSLSLEPHFDLCYYESQPGVVLLLCLREHPVHLEFREPHIKLNGSGQIVGFKWSPLGEGPLQVPEEDVIPYYEAYACLSKALADTQFQVRHRLVQGDMLTVNNHRCLHGRDAFELNGGTRHLINIYVNLDEFQSRFKVLCSYYAPEYHAKHCLNNDHVFRGNISKY